MSPPVVLDVRRLDVFYGGMQAVYDVGFKATEASMIALLGANGAGKTTILRALTGLIPMRSGEISFQGKPVGRMTPERRVAVGMALVPDDRRLFRTLTVEENLRAGGYRRSRSEMKSQMELVFTYFPSLGQRRHQLAGSLSGGQAQMLAISRALMTGPSLLLLDEPSQGLAPKIVEEVFKLIVQLSGEANLTIVLVEQNATLALDVASYGYVLRNGKIELEGTTSQLRSNDHVRELYLGG